MIERIDHSHRTHECRSTEEFACHPSRILRAPETVTERYGDLWRAGSEDLEDSPDTERPAKPGTRLQLSREVAEVIGKCLLAAREVAEVAGEWFFLAGEVAIPW